MSELRSALYEGHVTHVRRTPARNAFTYPIYELLVDLDELDELSRRLRLFSSDRRNVCELRSGDHLGDPALPIKQNLQAFLRSQGVDPPEGTVQLLTHARTFGYVFNPVSFYWCRHADGSLGCVVAEVHNTFGERFAYVLGEPTPGEARIRFSVDKRFHVSPFMPVAGRYEFLLHEPGERLFARIDERRDGERFFAAWLTGQRLPLTNGNLTRMLARHPLVTAQVVGRIHLQALRLWRLGTPFHRKPAFDPERGSAPARA